MYGIHDTRRIAQTHTARTTGDRRQVTARMGMGPGLSAHPRFDPLAGSFLLGPQAPPGGHPVRLSAADIAFSSSGTE